MTLVSHGQLLFCLSQWVLLFGIHLISHSLVVWVLNGVNVTSTSTKMRVGIHGCPPDTLSLTSSLDENDSNSILT